MNYGHNTTVYILHATHADWSIKNSENHFFIKSPNKKIPPNFVAFLRKRQNKARLFELDEEVWVRQGSLLGNRVINFSRRDLRCNHEEADTKVCFLLHHALQQNEGRETICVLVLEIC